MVTRDRILQVAVLSVRTVYERKREWWGMELETLIWKDSEDTLDPMPRSSDIRRQVVGSQ